MNRTIRNILDNVIVFGIVVLCIGLSALISFSIPEDYCPSCGKNLENTLNYCPNCGQKLDSVYYYNGFQCKQPHKLVTNPHKKWYIPKKIYEMYKR